MYIHILQFGPQNTLRIRQDDTTAVESVCEPMYTSSQYVVYTKRIWAVLIIPQSPNLILLIHLVLKVLGKCQVYTIVMEKLLKYCQMNSFKQCASHCISTMHTTIQQK